jgi:hypothetical protein
MCTVSVVPTASGFRLMCNRDELTTRPPALLPRVRQLGAISATYPIDPWSGGTWVAVNDAGLAVTLLNRSASPRWRTGTPGMARPAAVPRTRVFRSRGQIVPRLVSAATLPAVLQGIRLLQPAEYAGFHIVAIQGDELVLATSNGTTIDITEGRLWRPMMFTSSSLGDDAAERFRRPLFETLVLQSTDPVIGQRHFHAHRWPHCPSFSVRMSRADARTVSQSIVSVDRTAGDFQYEPFAAD